MFRNLNIRKYIFNSSVAAIVYGIAAFIFVYRATYVDTWILYVGNSAFMVAIAYFMFQFNHRREGNASATSMVIAGHVTTVIGTILATLLGLLLLIIMVPGFFEAGDAGRVLQDEPANMPQGNTDGLGFIVVANAIFGNASMGSFVSLILAFTLKRNQARESRSYQKTQL